MMKNKSTVFVALCIVLCLIPSLGMLFFPTTRTTENRPMTQPPKLMTDEGGVNLEFFRDLESYINEHIALRNELVYADGMIQSGLFHQSNVSGVISGSDGWLYYSSTMDDYLGKNIMSARELNNLAGNIAVIQDYTARKGMDFLFTIPPNKNTLYPQNMPYYQSRIIDPDHSAKLLAPYLQEKGVSYLDLFTLFEQQEQTLYLRRDSHWNGMGACLAYNAIMDSLGYAHEDYTGAEPVLVKNENGDLNKMIYSFYGPLEENYDYGISPAYTFEKDGATVEDGWIVSHNPEGTGTLLMFRDSFANTLIPFLSNEFETACYSKGQPNALERYVESYQPDCVVLEKVERNIRDYLDHPPVLTAPKTRLPDDLTIAQTDTTVMADSCKSDVNYYQFTGNLDVTRMETDTKVLVSIDGNVYRAYQTGETGYLVYLKKAQFTAPQTDVKVYMLNADKCILAASETITLPNP